VAAHIFSLFFCILKVSCLAIYLICYYKIKSLNFFKPNFLKLHNIQTF